MAIENGISLRTKKICKRKWLPILKYNKQFGVWRLYFTRGGKRMHKVYECYLEDEDVAYLKKWFVLTETTFKSARRSGSVRVEPRRSVAGEINLAYFKKHRARYEYFKLYRAVHPGASDEEIEQNYLTK